MPERKKRPQLHVTSLNTISFCGIAFERRYMKGEKIPPSTFAVVGRGVDKSVTKNLEHKIASGGELLTLEELREEAASGVTNDIEMEGLWIVEPEEIAKGLKKLTGEAVDKAVRLSDLHAIELAPVIQPKFVQRPFTLELPGYPFDIVGTMDIQEEEPTEGGRIVRIRDTKTSGKTPAQSVADSSVQLTGYALALRVLEGREPDEVTLDYLIDTKKPKTAVLTSKRTMLDFQTFLRRVEAALKVIETGAFLPAKPGDPLCSEKFCGYWSTCDYVQKNPVTVGLG